VNEGTQLYKPIAELMYPKPLNQAYFYLPNGSSLLKSAL
jgi:hypothetical protein